MQIESSKWYAIYNRYYDDYFSDLNRLLIGKIKNAAYFNYREHKETHISRQELADLIDDYNFEARPLIMAGALEMSDVGRASIIKALDRIAADGAERAAQYYFDNALDLEKPE